MMMTITAQVTMIAMHIAMICGITYQIIRGEQTHKLSKSNNKMLKNGNGQ